MNVSPICSDADLTQAQRRLDELLAVNAYESELTDENLRDEFELLTAVIYYYEQRSAEPGEFSLAGADVIELVEEILRQKQLSAAAAQLLAVSAEELSQVLSRRQPVSFALAKRLHQRLGVPAEALLTMPE